MPTISSNLQLGMHDSLIAVNEANLLASPTSSGSPLKESALLAEQVATTPHRQLCTIVSPCLFSLLICPHTCALLQLSSLGCIFPFLLHDFRSSSTPHCAPELSQYAETGPKRVWQCSKGEAKSAIGLALAQRHPSSSGSRSSLGSVGWLPQWTPFVLAQLPSLPQPPPPVQRSFSLSPNKPPWQPSPSVLRNGRSPTAPSSPGALSTMVVSTPSGPVMTTASGVALHGRHLNEVSASTVGEFTAAIADSSINKILLAAGTYELTTDMCAGAAVCISRTLIIEAEVPGAVVFNAMGGERRVFDIQSGGTVELIGLNITGGYADSNEATYVCWPSALA